MYADYEDVGLVRRTDTDTVLGVKVNEAPHFDLSYIGTNGVMEGVDVLDGLSYSLFLMEDLSRYAWSKHAKELIA